MTSSTLPKSTTELDRVVIRFAGDSGDGMQLAGNQFTNDVGRRSATTSHASRLPRRDPRPAGTLAGVSGFQVHFSSDDIHTPGDRLDALVAMNPAALKTNLKDLKPGGILIVNTDAFDDHEPRTRPATRPTRSRTASLDELPAFTRSPIDQAQPRRRSKDSSCHPRRPTAARTSSRSGLVYWLYERAAGPTLNWIQEKFAKNPSIAEANITRAQGRLQLRRDDRGLRRSLPGAEGDSCRPARTARSPATRRSRCGLVAAAPSWPASRCSTAATRSRRRATSCTSSPSYKHFGVTTFQAEDEIAAIGAAIGAASAAPSASPAQRPGHRLKSEAIGLAVMTELPLRHHRRAARRAEDRAADQDRAGRPAAGDVRPQRRVPGADRRAGVAGRLLRHGHRGGPHRDRSYMTPVFLLSDGYIANGAEPWRIPDARRAADDRRPTFATESERPDDGERLPAVQARRRDAGAAVGDPRHAGPGAPHRRHREAGRDRQRQLRRRPTTSTWSAPRAEKVANIADDIPSCERRRRRDGRPAGHRLGRHVRRDRHGRPASCSRRGHKRRPRPPALPEPAARRTSARCSSASRRCWCPRLNIGQLRLLLRGKFLVDAQRPEQGAGQAVPGQRDDREDRRAARRGDVVRRLSLPAVPPSASDIARNRQLPYGDRHESTYRQTHRPDAKDFASDQEVRWCPGCGDYSILAQMKKVLPDARHPAREDGVRLRHRLLQPVPVLHEHLRLPHHPRPGADVRHRPEAVAGPTCRSGWSPATATGCRSAATT